MGKRWQVSLSTLRWLTLLAPPVALVLLWLTPKVSLRQKIFGSLGIPLFAILYVTAAVWLIDRYLHVELYEWRGGYIPTLTIRPTRTDFEAVEAQRRQQKQASPPQTNTLAGGISWTDFRGPNRDGLYDERPINIAWDKSPPKLLWKQPIGGGYASFVIARGVAYTIEQRRAQEVVTAYDVASGREIWAHGWDAEFVEPTGGNGPRATPTWHDGKIYAQGATGELQCLDAATGALIWRHDILKENFTAGVEYGCSVSPLVVDDLVVTLPGGAAGHSVVAYDRLTGAKKWSLFDDRQAYVSPAIVTLAGERQLLIVAAQRTMGLRIADGKLLWDYAWGEPFMGRNIAQPVVWNGNRVLLSAGYSMGSVAIQIEQRNGVWSVQELWKNKLLKNKFSSSVFWKGHIYGLDEDILTCLDAETGGRKWKDGRFGYGQLILASGHLIILCGDGDLAIVKAAPEKFEQIARIQGIQGKTWNHPALADGKLLIRNLAEMACFDLSIAK